LEDVTLSNVLVGEVGSGIAFPPNTTVRSLFFSGVNFEEHSLSSMLRHFPSTGRLIFECCENVSAEILESLPEISGTEELDILSDDEDECNRLSENISKIVSSGPPKISISLTRQ